MHDPEFVRERRDMVKSQLELRGITDKRVLDAMRAVPRHLFVPAEMRSRAYEDSPLAIGCGQTISQPYMVAIMTQLLEISPDDGVLEVGTGSAYQTAILATLAGYVVTIERQPMLAARARKMLGEMGFANVNVIAGDGSVGSIEDAPFDAILVTAGSPRVPPSLREQLAVGGRLICPVGTRKVQKIVRIRRTAAGFIEDEGIGCVFVPLIGLEGWED